jgi:H-type small acid-soluble spore protein
MELALNIKKGMCGMDNKRVREIINSLGVIEVLYQGRPVWIEDVDGSLAQVRYLDARDSFEVPVGELKES